MPASHPDPGDALAGVAEAQKAAIRPALGPAMKGAGMLGAILANVPGRPAGVVRAVHLSVDNFADALGLFFGGGPKALRGCCEKEKSAVG
jgi:hypothetical protein